ncbi:BRCA1-associated protein [Trichonephila clavipes]|nr:BRCA1-associated protein [Trichonephila clavipes]
MACFDHQSLLPIDLGRVDEEMASPGERICWCVVAANASCLAVLNRGSCGQGLDVRLSSVVALIAIQVKIYNIHFEEEYASYRKPPDGLDSTSKGRESTGTTILRQTVYRRLGHIGLYARRPVRCVSLTATHCRLRLT